MRRLLLLLVVGLTLALLLPLQASPGYSPSQLNAVASWLAMRPVAIDCQFVEESEADIIISVYGASAYVEGWRDSGGYWHPFSIATFAFGHCEQLLDLIDGNAALHSLKDLSWSILVLTHESGHLRGHRWGEDEAKTQCWAMQHFRHVARRLGVTDDAVLSELVREARIWHAGMPGVYHGVPCKLPTP